MKLGTRPKTKVVFLLFLQKAIIMDVSLMILAMMLVRFAIMLIFGHLPKRALDVPEVQMVVTMVAPAMLLV